MAKLYVYIKHEVWKAPQFICVHVHTTYITYRESAMEKVAQQLHIVSGNLLQFGTHS